MSKQSMPSVMKHSFSQVPQANINRSTFDRSHGYKTTFDSGYLIPFFWDMCLPGDTFTLQTSAFCRAATPIVPVMDNAFLETHYFAIPLRLVWNNFQKFMGEQASPGDSTSFTVPTITSTAVTGYTEQTIYDYFGIPTKVPGLVHSALPLRCYNLVWQEWFRDENLQNAVTLNKGDGPDAPTDYAILRRGKRHDYFTSCLPWPQKGAAVSLPLGTVAPIKGIDVDTKVYSQDNATVRTLRVTNASGNIFANAYSGATATMRFSGSSSEIGLQADLSSATAATINSLRQAFQLQALLERDARGGTRYNEIIRSHFGVISPDARLQRSEFLQSGKSQINYHPVPQMSNSDTGVTPQGNLAAFGTGSFSGHGFVKSFTEHTIVLGLLSVRADLNYQQSLNRLWSWSTRYDFYWPTLAHLGEQAVLNKEIYAVGSANPTQDAAAFGYQERYAELKYKPSQITGKFRSNATGTLDIWHLAQNFSALPTLGNTFIQDTPPFNRIMAVKTEPEFLVDIFNKLICARPMPVYSVPANFGRF